MTRLAAAALALALLLAPGNARSGTGLYICTVEQALGWGERRLGPTPLTEHIVGRSRTLIFDSASGMLRFSIYEPVEYEIVQRPGVNSLLAKREIRGTGRYVLSVLRIRTWQEPLSFLYLREDSVFSGPCREN